MVRCPEAGEGYFFKLGDIQMNLACTKCLGKAQAALQRGELEIAAASLNALVICALKSDCKLSAYCVARIGDVIEQNWQAVPSA